MKVEDNQSKHVFEVQVYLSDLDPSAVQVELYADGIDGAEPVCQEMQRKHGIQDVTGGYIYSATVPSVRPAADYTARLIPHLKGAAIPLESAKILWQQ